jgi:hypothetical protein
MARKDKGEIEIDTQTTLRGVPAEAWEYRLGTYSALEWILERYKEKKPNVTYVQIVGEMQNLAKKLNFSNCRLSGRLMDIIGTGNIHEQKHSICYPGNRSRHVSGLGPIGPLFGNPAGVR